MPILGSILPGLAAGLAGLCLLTSCLFAETHTGIVRFGGLPLPGASVAATQGSNKLATITDMEGRYRIEGLSTTPFSIEVAMQLFAIQTREFAGPDQTAEWDMKLLRAEHISANVVRLAAAETAAFQRTAVKATGEPKPPQQSAQPGTDRAISDDLARQAADGFLISGSVHNAASSPFAQLAAFGNNRRGRRSLYNGNLGVTLNHSLFDARAFSLTGQNTPKPDYNRIQGLLSFGGPLRIPGLLQNGPTFSLNYQWTRNRNAATQSALMPTSAERAGIFSSLVIDPATGLAFPDNRIPPSRISPQARALLRLFPEPNFPGSDRYNFQLPIVSGLHQDDLQSRASKQVKRNAFSGNFNWQSIRTDTPDLFGFLDTGRVGGFNTTAGYRRIIHSRSFVNVTLNYNRLTTRVTPYFSERDNISGDAGIGGNNQEPVNWGPPNLMFTGGIAPLTEAQASLVRNQTTSVSLDYFVNRGRHNLSAGITLRRQQFNLLTQQDARGTFAFTGEAAGNDFAGFLLGVPDTSSIAFGNADKYLRGRVSEVFINDDWRVNPSLTINAGARWEYWSPVTEKYGRLVNLDVTPGFTSAVPGNTLPRPDRNNLAPRIAFSWRPMDASSMVVRGGYGIYYDTSIYQPIAVDMSQQAPLSKNLRLSNTPSTPLTLANGFPEAGATSATTFGVDPWFRIGYLHTWKFSVQSDLPAALQFTASYSGNKGMRGQQQILPNTFPNGAISPSGFVWLTSNGQSVRHAMDVQLRRRMRSGLTAQLQYTWAKALDNALLGGKDSANRARPLIAQNWLDLDAERGRSSFDQRHLLSASLQYTTGMGLRGGSLLSGRIARLLKEWTIGSQLTWGSGLPLTPLYAHAVPGTGFTGVLRPDYTGAPLYDAPAGLHLNPAAVAAPAPGTWGNAGRNSITGPGQFVINSSLGRTLRSWDRVSMDLRIDATNSTNTPTFPSWNTVAGNAQFGLPNVANPMRIVQVTIRMGF
jgi:trimeric autotransporter adhesin